MKLNRRGLFAATMGGVAAAPSIARDALAKAPTPYNFVGETMAKAADEKQWRLAQIERAKRLAAGDFRDEDRNYPTEGAPCPYAPLRSVSDAAKHVMRNARWERKWRADTTQRAIKALAEYDKTGFLRHLI